MLKGVWSFNIRGREVAFTSGIVVIAADNRYVGGDSSYYFTGTLTQNGSRIASEAKVTHHFGSRLAALETLDHFTITLAGTANATASIMQLGGNIAEKPELCVLVGLSKLEDWD